MAIALIEDPRTTLYRQRLAQLLRRPSCRWMSFSVGTAPIHRSFFEDLAAEIEGRPTGTPQQNGVGHRQVQYGVRLRIVAREDDRASYDAERDLLIVPEEAAFDTLDGQAKLISACVHLGLDLEARNHQALDSECAARIAGYLYRLYEAIATEETETETAAKLQQLTPASAEERPFFAVAADILRHCRATLRANRRNNHPLQPGSFMKIVRTSQRDQLHALLFKSERNGQSTRRPSHGILPRSSRFLAFQSVQPAALRAA
ncbi:MAG: hypothetical protein ACREEV_14930 [Dongiaceae bacterium]